MKKVRTDLITGVVLAAVSVLYFALSYQIRQVGLISITSAFIPRLCAVCLFLLSAAMLVRSVKRARALGGKEERGQAAQERSDGRAKLIAAAAAFVALGVGILLMERVGFVAGMAVYLLASFFCFSRYEKKNWLLFVLLAVVVPVLIYLAFTRAFNLRLPQGILDIGGGIL